MGRHSPQPTQRARSVDFGTSCSYAWIQSIQKYLYRFIVLQKLANEMLNELPAARQSYYTEQLRGIDTRVKREYYGIQNPTDGTT
jgi:hypothetical protein